MSNVPLRPLADRLVAMREEAATKTATGLYLPADTKEKSQIGSSSRSGCQRDQDRRANRSARVLD